MDAYASASYSLAVPMPQINTLTRLRAKLEAHHALPLVFTYGGKAIAAGYHVTEIKAAQFSSLDCGANPESWSETIIQLWDVESTGATHMKVSKFLGILSQVERRVALDPEALLIFEAGDSVSPMQVFTIGSIATASDHVGIALAPRPATCKPRDRGLENALNAVAVAPAESKSCCGPNSSAKAACCS
jgi:hypothetical protein